MHSDVVVDDGESAVNAVLVPKPLADAFVPVPLPPGSSVVLIEGPVDDADEGFVRSLQKDWDAGAKPFAGAP